MKLIRTIKKASIVYYWKLDEELEPNSPLFKTLDDAKDWMTQRFFSLYDGPERRKSIIDRRHNYQHRSHLSDAAEDKVVSLYPLGRREADQYNYTFIDRVSDVMQKLRNGSISPDALI